jgi:hypothetical protein
MFLAMFVLIVAQAAGVAHATADVFHQNHLQEIQVTSADDAPDLGAWGGVSDEGGSCQHGCYHTHLFMGFQPLDFYTNQRVSFFSNTSHTVDGLLHGPDAPPPNFS